MFPFICLFIYLFAFKITWKLVDQSGQILRVGRVCAHLTNRSGECLLEMAVFLASAYSYTVCPRVIEFGLVIQIW